MNLMHPCYFSQYFATTKYYKDFFIQIVQSYKNILDNAIRFALTRKWLENTT